MVTDNKAASFFAYVNVNIPNLTLQEKENLQLHYNQVDTRNLVLGVGSTLPLINKRPTVLLNKRKRNVYYINILK